MEKPNEINSFEELQENLRGIYELRPVHAGSQISAISEFYLCGRMIFSHFSFTPFCFNRDPKDLNDFNTEYLLLERYLTGDARGIIADTSLHINSNTLHLVDWSRRQRSVTSTVTGQSFMIPHDLIGYDPSRDPAYISLNANSTEGYLTSAVFDQFYAAARDGRMDEATTCADLCVSLVRRLVHGVEAKTAEDTHLRVDAARVRSFIRQELSDPLIDPDRICSALNISRATLYRLFVEEGGVVRYIDKLRLQKCFNQLLDASGQRGEVRRIAEAWGYHDPATFNKKFRRLFNVTPSECLGSRQSLVDANANIREIWPINNWLKTA